MNVRLVELSTDTFAALWSARREGEHSEDDIICRLLLPRIDSQEIEHLLTAPASGELSDRGRTPSNLPKSIKWTDLLVWTLEQLGGEAPLEEIYRVSREGRRSLGRRPTREHNASARECLESHCLESEKYRGKSNLFRMPKGKGAGVWALR